MNKTFVKSGKSVSVSFILDKSGSMESVKSATISGFNEYIQTLKKDTDTTYDFSLVLFDTDLVEFERVNVKEVLELTENSYKPQGGTALYDAACDTIKTAEKNNAGKNLAVIMTDGGENASKEYSEKDLKAMIERLEKTGKWTFVFLGANQDSYAVAQKFGVSNMNISNFKATQAGMGATMRAMATNTVAYAASANTTTDSFFSKSDQENLQNTK